MVDITPLETYQLLENYHDKIRKYSFCPSYKNYLKSCIIHYLSPKELLLVKTI